MALEIEKSMDVIDFWYNWEHIMAMVESEYRAVEGLRGSYFLDLKLVWDVDEEECNSED